MAATTASRSRRRGISTFCRKSDGASLPPAAFAAGVAAAARGRLPSCTPMEGPMPRWLVPIALLLAVAGASPSRAGDAEDCGNAATLAETNAAGVVAACRRLAERGDAIAQNNLGALYES